MNITEIEKEAVLAILTTDYKAHGKPMQYTALRAAATEGTHAHRFNISDTKLRHIRNALKADGKIIVVNDGGNGALRIYLALADKRQQIIAVMQAQGAHREYGGGYFAKYSGMAPRELQDLCFQMQLEGVIELTEMVVRFTKTFREHLDAHDAT